MSDETPRNPDGTFPPGVSGNPGGMLKGYVSLRIQLRNKLQEGVQNDSQGRTYSQALIDATIRDALKGDASARKLVWEYIDGKAPADPEGEREGVAVIIDDV